MNSSFSFSNPFPGFRVVARGWQIGNFLNNIGNVSFIDNDPIALFGSLLGGVGEIVNHLPLVSSPGSSVSYPIAIFAVSG